MILVLIIIVFVIIQTSKTAKSGREKTERSTATTKPLSMSERKRAEAARPEQWRAAKRQQDDAEQLHSVKMDACESKLESLRALYDAGILDHEEYAQRVARVRKQHARNAGR